MYLNQAFDVAFRRWYDNELLDTGMSTSHVAVFTVANDTCVTLVAKYFALRLLLLEAMDQ